VDDRSQEAVEAAERFADGVGHPEDRAHMFREAGEAYIDLHDDGDKNDRGRWHALTFAAVAAQYTAAVPGEFGPDPLALAAEAVAACSRHASYSAADTDFQAGLLREVFGNPFRPATIRPGCVKQVAMALAPAGFKERALPSGEFDPARLSVLADALEEAGCADPDLLGHLRAPGAQVRECCALDLILGKA
jgi:hypothetical protein